MHSGRLQTVWKRAKFLIKNATKQKQRTKTDCWPARLCVCECVVRISESTCVRLYWFTHMFMSVCACVCVLVLVAKFKALSVWQQ